MRTTNQVRRRLALGEWENTSFTPLILPLRSPPLIRESLAGRAQEPTMENRKGLNCMRLNPVPRPGKAWFAAILLCGWSGWSATTHDVEIRNFAFSPSELTVNAGDTVRWTQYDGAIHTTTSTGGIWDSGSMAQNAVFSWTFNTVGTFPYVCTPHSSFMVGTITVISAANIAPTVAITSPTNSQRFTLPASVTITANASDVDGTVTSVAFFDGTTSLGVDNNTPYSVTASLGAGSHVLTAVVTDNGGATNTSAQITINVGGSPIDDPIVERIPKGSLRIELENFADGMIAPLGTATPADGSGRLFVYDQAGLVWVLTSTGRVTAPLIDVRSRLVPLGAYDERGLLGMALHPNFVQNGLFYLYTSEPTAGPADFPIVMPTGRTNNHQSVIAEWRVSSGNANAADPGSRREVLRLDKPQSNHNGGTLRFGPDGMLYVSIGDGGGADDEGDGHLPGGNAQALHNVLGKVLRIDVDGRNSTNGQYGIPSDNPFVGSMEHALAEIYAYGLRNPFTYSFDRVTGQLFLGDAGQNKIEEIDIIIKGGNYGWNRKEGTFFFDGNGPGAGYVTDTPAGVIPEGLIDPIAEYDHDEGAVVVGGFVYRGTAIPALQGRYVFADWGTFGAPSGRLFYLDETNGIKEFQIGLEDRPLGWWVRGFGEDAAGELYVMVGRTLGPNGDTGTLLKVVGPPAELRLARTSPGSLTPTNVWSGGTGPFVVQHKARINDLFWNNVAFTPERGAPVNPENRTGFYRVVDVANQPGIPLSAHLSGLHERPTPVTNSATGSGTFSLAGNKLTFSVQYSGLSELANAAHIHGPAAAAGGTGVLINLAPYHVGSYSTQGTFSGTITLTPAQKAYVLAGRTYVNLHTPGNSAGALRGQIAPVLMRADFNHQPAGTNQPKGSATLALVGNKLSFNVSYSGLSGPATMAHIHGPATASQSAGVLVDLAPFNGGAFARAGNLSGTVALTETQLAYVIDGLTYINFHTDMNAGGEIRGQILPQSTAVPLSTWMTGLAERPTPITNNATGSGLFSLEGNVLTFNVAYKGLSGPATGMHIHGPATAGGSNAVIVNLAPYHVGSFGSEGTISGSLVLSRPQRLMVVSGLTYVNVHTAQNTHGELRGQVAPVLMQANLNGANERPNPINTPATGIGVLALVWNQLAFNVTYRDLTGIANNSHIHGPGSVFQSVGVMVDLAPYNGGAFGTSGALAGTVALAPSQLASVVDGLTYINVHTPANGAGEIRGQITP